jgi:hypothetical protein
MNAIWYDRIEIAKHVNATVISLDEAPQGYKDFDKGNWPLTYFVQKHRFKCLS